MYFNGGQQSWTGWTTTRYKNPFSGNYLEGLDDEQLSSVARDYVFLCQTALRGPWKIDAFKRNLIQEEFIRREKPELFEVAEKFILNSLKG